MEHDIQKLCRDIVQSPSAIAPGSDQVLAAALLQRNVDWMQVAHAALVLVQSDPATERLLSHGWAGNAEDLQKLWDSGEIIAFLTTPLMQAMLQTTPIPDLKIESLLVYARKRMMQHALDLTFEADAGVLAAASALACNAFLTEYVFQETAQDSLNMEILTGNIEASTPATVSAFEVAVLGSYRPLFTSGVLKLIERAPWFKVPGPMQSVIRLQIHEPAREQELDPTIPIVTPINDGVSATIRDHYEENPYPRWSGFSPVDPSSPSDVFARCCPGVDRDAFGSDDALNILIAGCGTGRVALDASSLWAGSKITALDLSRASLRYGKRSAEFFGYPGIDFVQGDILEVGALETTFDYIESGGVLHHMADPNAGLRALANVCRPGGVLRISLYSKKARAAIGRSRPIIRAMAKDFSAKEMRKARHEFIDYALRRDIPQSSVLPVFSAFDFYSLSMLRDLLFHSQEIYYDIPMVAHFAEQAGLRFCGFVDPTGERMAAYRRFAPEDTLCTDLDALARHEATLPESAVPMYEFMLQKPLV